MAIPDFYYDILKRVISKKALFISPSHSSILDKSTNAQQVLCNWGSTLKQSSAMHIPALYSADGILLGISSYHQHLIINLTSVPGSCWSIPQLHKASTVVGKAKKHHVNENKTFNYFADSNCSYFL